MANEPSTAGWDAISAQLKRVYGDAKEHHFAPPLPAQLGGSDPLDGISVFRSSHGGRSHWHFVTFGYSELYEKETDDPSTSGYGFEMTIRVTDPESSDEPPAWPLSLLQNLARYVFRTGNVFKPGHHTNLNGPIALGRETQLVAAAFADDPQLGALDTPNGRVGFLQLVGLTEDEFDAVRGWDTLKFLQTVARREPALISDLARNSWLADPALRTAVDEGTRRDGSSLATVFASKGGILAGQVPVVLEVAANCIADLHRLVRGRLAFGRETLLRWPGGAVVLGAGPKTKLVEAPDELPLLELDAADQARLLELPVARGDYPLPSGRVNVRVLPVDIWNADRTRVEKTIG